MDRIEEVKSRLMDEEHGCYRIMYVDMLSEPKEKKIFVTVDVDHEGKTKRFLIRIGISSMAYDNPSFDLCKMVSENVEKTVGVAIKRASW